jgi:hypothetical protein
VRFARKIRHAASKAARAWSKVAAAPFVHSRGCDPRPAPRILVRRNADALGDRADVDVSVVDVSAFILRFEIAAAGEGGHALLKRSGCADAIRPSRENKQRSAVYRPCTTD